MHTAGSHFALFHGTLFGTLGSLPTFHVPASSSAGRPSPSISPCSVSGRLPFFDGTPHAFHCPVRRWTAKWSINRGRGDLMDLQAAFVLIPLSFSSPSVHFFTVRWSPLAVILALLLFTTSTAAYTVSTTTARFDG
jgi:hypothetical protein